MATEDGKGTIDNVCHGDFSEDLSEQARKRTNDKHCDDCKGIVGADAGGCTYIKCVVLSSNVCEEASAKAKERDTTTSSAK